MTTDTEARIAAVKQEIFDEWQSPEIIAAYRKWDVQETAWGR